MGITFNPLKSNTRPKKSVARVLLRAAKGTISKKAIIASAISAAIGLAIVVKAHFEDIISYLISIPAENIGYTFVLVPFTLIFFIVYFRMLRNMIRRKPYGDDSDDFLSVDRRSANRRNKESFTPQEIFAIIKSEGRQEHLSQDKIREIVEQTLTAREKNQPNNPATFTSYFTSIVETLEAKADAADEKASILLNKGTSYSKWGIAFFIVSIATWQVLAWANQFQNQFLYGIISCSILFAFIEFLSAWFLRQYRHFVDTSTYLLRVKSILDRYLLTYLAAKEQAKVDGSIDGKAFTALNALLKEPIKWPETELFDKANTNFAKDAAESITFLAKELKDKK
ncbi:hypothetical protein [Prosthecobacter sp.]|uniref:hypothetical protein n=1 Tax=Prosthecobacter sp. TaxID=1965333 RepID=UPI0037850A87